MTTRSDRWQYPKAAPTPGRVCVDCALEHAEKGAPLRGRPAPFPGPRCHTHDVIERKRKKKRAKEKRVEATYTLTGEKYDELYRSQAGRCAICRRATGSTKRLAVDHDHACCAGPTSCGRCVRGLLCDPCNRILGHFRDDPAAGERLAGYLRSWPSRRAGVVPPADAVYDDHHD